MRTYSDILLLWDSSLSSATATISTQSHTSSTTSSAPSAATSFGGCPSANMTRLELGGQQYLVLCQMDFGPDSTNVQNSTQSTFPDCLNQCNAYSIANTANPCKGVAWDVVAPNSPPNSQICWLKSSVGTLHWEPESFQTVISATVVDST